MEQEESFADVNYFNLKSKNSSNKETKNEPKPEESANKVKIKFNPKDPYYDMSGDKYLVIFNHYSYKATRFYRHKAPSTRRGTEQDVKRLEEVFGKLGFEVIVHEDLDYDEIWRLLLEIRNKDHSGTSCLCVAILTHGDNRGWLYAADRGYELTDVIKLYEGHPTLVNKPKIFFIQACRGEEVDTGTICTDGDMGDCTYVTPSHADFLVMRSTVEDFRSYRDIRGSWMIQELCNIITEHHKTSDLLHMVTKVHQKVAYNYATYTPSNVATHAKKQIPETSFTLTKLVQF